MKFCEKCQAFVVIGVSSTNELQFVCNNCNSITPASHEDTLVYKHDRKNTHIDFIDNIIKNAHAIPCIPRVQLENGCYKCGKKIVNYIRIGEEHRRLFICPCKHYWRE